MQNAVVSTQNSLTAVLLWLYKSKIKILIEEFIL